VSAISLGIIHLKAECIQNFASKFILKYGLDDDKSLSSHDLFKGA
jgi:hypothetical protein